MIIIMTLSHVSIAVRILELELQFYCLVSVQHVRLTHSLSLFLKIGCKTSFRELLVSISVFTVIILVRIIIIFRTMPSTFCYHLS